MQFLCEVSLVQHRRAIRSRCLFCKQGIRFPEAGARVRQPGKGTVQTVVLEGLESRVEELL